jgi:hypothetical protein
MPIHRLLLACALLFPAGLGAQQTPPEADRRMAREILAELVAINTTQDSGATRAARALARRLTAAGFPAKGRAARRTQAAEAEPGGPPPRPWQRQAGSLPRSPRRGRGRREDWSVDPFRLTERDGWLYGRGTIDIKDEAADLVTNLIRLRRERYVPDRDIIIALTDDEEGGDDNGAQWLLANRPEWIAADYAINLDAGGAQMQNGRPAPESGADQREDLRHLSLRGHRARRAQLAAPSGATPSTAWRVVSTACRSTPSRCGLTETTRGFFDRPRRPDRRARPARPAGYRGRTRRQRGGRAGEPDAGVQLLDAKHLRRDDAAGWARGERACRSGAQATVQCRLLPRVSGRDPRHPGARGGGYRHQGEHPGQAGGAPESPVNPQVMTAVEEGDPRSLAGCDRPAGDGPVGERRRALPPGRDAGVRRVGGVL